MVKGHVFGIVVLGLWMAPLAAQAGTLSTLYVFKGGADASQPNAGVIDVAGILYGTSTMGGTANNGTVFSVNAATGAETVVYSFKGGTDGAVPRGSLIYENGVLYGTTSQGGEAGLGTVFAIDEATGTEKLLHSFTGGSDGSNPASSLLYRNGILYGTTPQGNPRGGGVLFKVDVKTRKEEVLHSFLGGSGSGDGYGPEAGVIRVGDVLYGTTSQGGGNSYSGTVYGFNLRSHIETLLYSFTGKGDGGYPTAALIYRSGLLYGTASCYGSGLPCSSSLDGTVFTVAVSSGIETTLQEFNGNPLDGGTPIAGLVYAHGAVYGTTSCFGNNSSNVPPVIYRIPVGERGEVVLYTFNDGECLGYGSLAYADGTFYGATSYRVFKFVP